MKRLMLRAALGSMLLGTGCAQAETPKKPIDISVALECRMVRSWVGHPFEIQSATACNDAARG
jgi:hypothetical protein